MPRIDVGRYKSETGWVGWMEPENLTWIVFVRDDGAVFAYNRCPKTGAVIGKPAVLQ